MITHLLFDLDNTLYSARYGLEKNVVERLEKFVSDYLNISQAESRQIHHDIINKYGYGTTIEWLIDKKKFTNIESYYRAIYPEGEADSLSPDPELGNFLASIPLPKAILTNSIQKHVDHILDKLEVKNRFNYIFDIRFNNFKGKPHADAFFGALKAMAAKPETTLFVDDTPKYVDGYVKIGGKALLFDEFDQYASFPYERIMNLREIKIFLELTAQKEAFT